MGTNDTGYNDFWAVGFLSYDTDAREDYKPWDVICDEDLGEEGEEEIG